MAVRQDGPQRRWGYRRACKALRGSHLRVDRERVQRLMREYKLLSVQRTRNQLRLRAIKSEPLSWQTQLLIREFCTYTYGQKDADVYLPKIGRFNTVP